MFTARTALIFFIGSGGIISLVLGTGSLLAPGKRSPVVFALFSILGGWLLLHAAYLGGGTVRHPGLIFVHIPAAFAIGPLLYFHFRRIAEPELTLSHRHLPHFLPCPVALFLLLPYFFSDDDYKLSVFQQAGAYPLLVRVITLGPAVFVLAYSLLAIFQLRFSGNEPARRLSRILAGLILLLTAMGLGSILYPQVAALNGALIVLLVIFVYFIGQRWPGFLGRFSVRGEGGRGGPRRSYLRDVNDVDGTVARLQALMTEERLYRRPRISLGQVARRLSLSPHQLSEILNTRLERNFWSYVNGYRVREAARILEENPGRTVLSVAFEVGFNSKSSFNAAFSREMGQSPKAFLAGRAASK